MLEYHTQEGRDVLYVAVRGIAWRYIGGNKRNTSTGCDQPDGSLAAGGVQREGITV